MFRRLGSSITKSATTTLLGSSSLVFLPSRQAAVAATTATTATVSFFSTSNNTMTKNAASSTSHYYTVGITGATGLIGTALQQELRKKDTVIQGKPVRIITFQRQDTVEMIENSATFFDDTTFTDAPKVVGWNPTIHTGDETLHIDPTVFTHMDAMVHLSGENISTGEHGSLLAPLGLRPWTSTKKQEIVDSRVKTTTALAKAIKASGNTQCDFLVASGIGVYGSQYYTGEEIEPVAADETTDVTTNPGFLAEVSRLWEAAATNIFMPEEQQTTTTGERKSGGIRGTNRVCQLRNGVVLSTQGGALQKLYPIFYMGGGGIVGTGRQYFPFISVRDMARAMVHVLATPSLHGPINLNGPVPATNHDFTQAMGTVMHRPTLLPFPAFMCRLLFGEMGEEILLGGTKAVPAKLLASGFQFLDPTVQDAVRSAMEDN